MVLSKNAALVLATLNAAGLDDFLRQEAKIKAVSVVVLLASLLVHQPSHCHRGPARLDRVLGLHVP